MPNTMENRAWAHRLERKEILRVLKKHHGNLTKTAKALKMPYSTLNYKIRVLDLKDVAVELRKARGQESRIPVVKVDRRPPEKIQMFVKTLGAE